MDTNFSNKGICPHCYGYILDIVDKNEKEKWITVRYRNGNIELKFYIIDLIEDYENDEDFGSITCDKENPPELPESYQWICKNCYYKMKDQTKENPHSDDEHWMDGLDDWR